MIFGSWEEKSWGAMIKKNISLSSYTSWRVGGEAEYYAAPKTVEELIEYLKWAQSHSLKVTLLGGGTNVLISDEGVEGLVIHLKFFQDIKSEVVNGFLQIETLAGTSKSQLLKIFLKHRLAPALFLGGLPGDVGGGVAMNAGVGENLSPREFVEITDWIEVISYEDFVVRRFEKEELNWSYRNCSGWPAGVISKVGLSWPNEPDSTIIEKVKKANQLRLSKQPLEWPSCGSVFRNPVGGKAGQLIEACGLKGFTIGGAQVSEKHANFIINRGKATSKDIRAVIVAVQDKFFQEKGVRLQTEVVFIE